MVTQNYFSKSKYINSFQMGDVRKHYASTYMSEMEQALMRRSPASTVAGMTDGRMISDADIAGGACPPLPQLFLEMVDVYKALLGAEDDDKAREDAKRDVLVLMHLKRAPPTAVGTLKRIMEEW